MNVWMILGIAFLVITIICVASEDIQRHKDMKDPEKFRQRVNEEIREMEGKNIFVSGHKAEVELMMMRALEEEGIDGVRRMVNDGFLDENLNVRYK